MVLRGCCANASESSDLRRAPSGHAVESVSMPRTIYPPWSTVPALRSVLAYDWTRRGVRSVYADVVATAVLASTVPVVVRTGVTTNPGSATATDADTRGPIATSATPAAKPTTLDQVWATSIAVKVAVWIRVVAIIGRSRAVGIPSQSTAGWPRSSHSSNAVRASRGSVRRDTRTKHRSRSRTRRDRTRYRLRADGARRPRRFAGSPKHPTASADL